MRDMQGDPAQIAQTFADNFEEGLGYPQGFEQAKEALRVAMLLIIQAERENAKQRVRKMQIACAKVAGEWTGSSAFHAELLRTTIVPARLQAQRVVRREAKEIAKKIEGLDLNDFQFEPVKNIAGSH